MKVSVLICSLWVDRNKPVELYKCISSINGADEILTLVTEKNTRLSFTESWNRLARISTGDYLIFIGDNNCLQRGNIRDLCIEDTITFPLVNNDFPKVPFLYCLPRNIYDKIGLYDPDFSNGVHWEDFDLWNRIKKNNINFKGVETVNFSKKSSGRSIHKIENMLELEDLNENVYFKKWGTLDFPNLEIQEFKKSKLFFYRDYFLDKLRKFNQLLFEWPLYLKGQIYQKRKRKR